MNSRQHWFWHCLLGFAVLVIFVMFNVAIYQRDEAQRLARPVIEVSGTTMTVTCPKPYTPTAVSPAPRQERFVL